MLVGRGCARLVRPARDFDKHTQREGWHRAGQDDDDDDDDVDDDVGGGREDTLERTRSMEQIYYFCLDFLFGRPTRSISSRPLSLPRS